VDSTSHSKHNHFALFSSSSTEYTLRTFHTPKLYELTTNKKSYPRQINGINAQIGQRAINTSTFISHLEMKALTFLDLHNKLPTHLHPYSIDENVHYGQLFSPIITVSLVYSYMNSEILYSSLYDAIVFFKISSFTAVIIIITITLCTKRALKGSVT
jgi:hypothetical protein